MQANWQYAVPYDDSPPPAAGGRPHAHWRQEFLWNSGDLLRKCGFSEGRPGHDDRQIYMRRVHGPLEMCVYRYGGESGKEIMVEWRYLTGKVLPTVCKMNETLWRAILRGLPNHVLLLTYGDG